MSFVDVMSSPRDPPPPPSSMAMARSEVAFVSVVRPRVPSCERSTTSTTYRVPQKVLFDDELSTSDEGTVATDVTEESLSVEPPPPPRLSPPRTDFSKLNQQIVEFQKLVRALDKATNQTSSPEHTWRTQTVLRSASDADREIGRLIRNHENIANKDPRIRASFQKLYRDYKRTHQLFLDSRSRHNAKQRAEISLLTAQRDGPPPASETVLEEDFFDKVMREREGELLKVREKMHNVNRIYKELGRIVYEQQEQIDKVEERTQEAKSNVICGLEQIRRNRTACGSLEASASFPSESFMKGNDTPRGSNQRSRPQPGQPFRWTMPLETFREDVNEIRKDLFGLGADMMAATRRRLLAAKQMMACTSSAHYVSEE